MEASMPRGKVRAGLGISGDNRTSGMPGSSLQLDLE
jgi:hypothetical protein